MNLTHVIAPIPLEELKKYFVNKDIFFVIDYSQSQLKGSKFLIYLGNLDLPVDVVNFDNELLKEYFHSSNIVNIDALETVAIEILFEYKGISDSNFYKEFIEENIEILEIWKSKLDSLTLYNLYTVSDDSLKNYVTSYPENKTNSLEGINFLSLIRHEKFFEWYQKVDESSLFYYSTYFNEYMFKGKSLYSFWANDNNPMFLLTFGIATGFVKPAEYAEAIRINTEELKV